MNNCINDENEKLHNRLKRIIGQVQAVDRMIEEDVSCEDVLSQINAAKSALHKAGQTILESHIKYCISERTVYRMIKKYKELWKDFQI